MPPDEVRLTFEERVRNEWESYRRAWKPVLMLFVVVTAAVMLGYQQVDDGKR